MNSIKVSGQDICERYKDVARQRLLIRVTAHYIHTISQGRIDMDSAVRIPCKIYHLSPLLAYNEGFPEPQLAAGAKLLDSGKVDEAAALLPHLTRDAKIRLLAELGTYYIFKPGNTGADLHMASEYIGMAMRTVKAQPVAWQIELQTLKAMILDQSGKEELAQATLGRVAELCRRSGNTRALARTLLISGRMLPYSNADKAIKFAGALQLFQRIGDKEKEIETLSEINIGHFVFKRYDAAEQVMKQIIALQTQIGFHHQQYVYDALAYLAIRKGHLEEGLKYSAKSLQSLCGREDSVFTGFFNYRRGVLSLRLKKPADALKWFDKSLHAKTAGTRLYWYSCFVNKVQVLNDLGKGAEAISLLNAVNGRFPPENYFEKMHAALLYGQTYVILKKYPIAEGNFQVFLAMAEHFPKEYIHDEFPAAYFEISKYYWLTGNSKKAVELLERGKALTAGPDMERLGAYYYNLFKIDSSASRYLGAINDLQRYHWYSDSAFSYDQQKKSEELMIRFEAERKDKDIRLLTTRNQSERIQRDASERTKNLVIAGSVLLVMFTGLLYKNYRAKQSSNRQLQANQLELDKKNASLNLLNASQQNLLKEKEWLMKEVHHRVKNNLQMVTSLLYSQSVYLQDDKARLAVNDSLRRMQAMSLVHEKLYQDENTYSVSTFEYINELLDYLQDSLQISGLVNIHRNIVATGLDISQAVPLALIINEGLVNAVKYAFLDGQKGTVQISLQQDGPGALKLTLSDNGAGLPPGLNVIEQGSLGLSLMHGLAQQLNGELLIESKNGVHIILRFPLKKMQ